MSTTDATKSVRTASDRAALAIGALAALLALGYAVALLADAVGRAPTLWRGVAVAGSLLPAAMCVLASRSPSRNTRACLAIAFGMASWGIGFAVYFTVYEHAAHPPIPSAADGFWAVFYVAVFTGLLLKARSLLPRNHRILGLHVLVGILAVAALMTALLFRPIVDAGAGDAAAVAVGLAYPAMDVVLLGLVISIIASMGWRLTPRWALITTALLLQIGGDMVYGWRLSHDSWSWGTPLEATWPVVQLLLACALLASNSRWERRTREPRPGLGMPLGFTVLAISVLAYGNFTDSPPAAALLGLAALLASAVLILMAVRELGELRAEVRIDPLTRLANHSHFHATLADEVDAAQAAGGELVLLLGDLDGFKGVNDRLGHACGDEILRQASDALRASFGNHLVGRLGGDEFGVVLSGTNLTEAAELADRSAVRIAGLTEGLGISWGAATFPSDGPSPQLLLVRADMALYEAKAAVEGSRTRSTVADQALRRQLEAYARDVRAGYARERRKVRELNDTAMATVMALAAAVEAKDDATGGHIHRVHDLGLVLAGIVCPEDVADPQLAYGFLLHDIGKLAVPDAILTKPGKLDDHEWEVMRSHPRAGINILAPVPFLGRALDVVGHHHERWDGGGYPDGLRGEEIPLWARIFAVADTVDAMTSDRPYRKGLPFETALEEVLAQSGRQFDPACAQALASIPREQILPLLEAHRDKRDVTVVR